VLFGGPGGDRLAGGKDADLLCGKDGVKGNDRLDGGPASDRGSADPKDTKVSIEAADSCVT
jgi:hypothetical protein